MAQINMNIAAESERTGIIETNILDIKEAIEDIRRFLKKQEEFVSETSDIECGNRRKHEVFQKESWRLRSSG